jgi:hypothetical protein
VLRDWGSDTLAWDTTGLAAGSYKIGLWARTTGSTGAIQASSEQTFTLSGAAVTCTSASFTALPATPQAPGTNVTLTASAPGCSPGEFKWWILPPGGGWSVLRDWGSDTLAWDTTGLAAGSYKIGLWARTTGSTGAIQASSEQTFTLAP